MEHLPKHQAKTKRPAVVPRVAGRLFMIEIPPVDWILESAAYMVGRAEGGWLVVIDRFRGLGEGVGWVGRVHRNFQAVYDDGQYDTSLLRPLAHALGIERFRWEGIWLSTDDYLADYPWHEPEAQKAFAEHRLSLLEAAGHAERARVLRAEWEQAR